MNIFRISACTAICLLIIAGMLVISCSDDDKSVASTPSWSWARLGTGVDVDSMVNALTVYDSKLVAGGFFHTAGGVSANRIAAWNGSSWAPFGTGMDSVIHALAVYDNKLIAAGMFSTAGVGQVRIVLRPGTVRPGRHSEPAWTASSMLSPSMITSLSLGEGSALPAG